MPYNTSTPEGIVNAKRQRREWYYRNRKHVIQNNQKYREKNSHKLRLWVRQLKSTLKCEICGENHPACLEFHHKDPSKKDIAISECISRGWSIESTKKEISKCQPLCSNCHQKHHWAENYANS